MRRALLMLIKHGKDRARIRQPEQLTCDNSVRSGDKARIIIDPVECATRNGSTRKLRHRCQPARHLSCKSGTKRSINEKQRLAHFTKALTIKKPPWQQPGGLFEIPQDEE